MTPPISILLAAQPTSDQPLVVVLLVLLCAAALVAVACRKFNVEAIPGYLLAGALVGPHAVGLITSESAAQPVTDLATVLLLFTIGKFLIGIYIGKSGIASGFGAAGSLIIILVWVYYSAQIFLIGAEFTWVYAHTFGSARDEPVADVAAAVAPGGAIISRKTAPTAGKTVRSKK